MKEIYPFSPIKVLYWKDKIAEVIRGKIPTPVTVEIDPSNACSSNCIWCYYAKYRKNAEIMPIVTLQNLIYDVAGMGVKSITFTGGGEPLTHPKISKAIDLAYDLGLKIGIITNGDGLTDNIAADIGRKCRFIRISVDAGTNDTHYKLKKPPHTNQLDMILERIELVRKMSDLYQNNIEIGASFLVHPRNFHEVGLFLSRVSELGIDYAQVKPCIGKGMEITDSQKDVVDYEVNEFIRDHRLKVLYNNFRFDEIRGLRKFTVCYAHYLVGIIGATGDTYLCCQYRGNKEWSYGNINDKPFPQLWFSDEHRDLAKKIYVHECPPCRYSGYNTIIEHGVNEDMMHLDFL